jgi:hypothetical protein
MVEIAEALRKAVEEVRRAELSEDLTPIAFREVLRYLLAAPLGAAGSEPSAGQSHEQMAVNIEQAPISRLAARTRLSVKALEDIFDIGETTVSLHVASSRISATKSRATRDVGLLVVAGRQGAGIDEQWTLVAHVREALQRYNRYDQSNFAANLKACDDVFNSKGKGNSAELRLTQPGWEAAAELMRSLVPPGVA